MAFRRVADATVAIGLPNGGNQYVKIGTILEADVNDPTKGLPYVMMLDPWIDLMALHTLRRQSGTSLPVSFYKIKENKDWPPPSGKGEPRVTTPARPASGFDAADDDIPF